MAAFSTDLRQRVVDAYDAKEGTQQALAVRFKVSYSWVRKILRQRRLTDSIDPLPHSGGQAPAFDDAAAVRLRDAVKADNDATLTELAKASGVTCSASAVFRALERLEITRKKSLGGRPSKTSRS
jgi:transposase